MEFFIRQNSTLPKLMVEVINESRNGYHQLDQYLSASTVTFSLRDVDTDVYLLANVPAGITINKDGSGYSVYYQFTKKTSSKIGRYVGEFKIIEERGEYIVPIRNVLYVNIIESFADSDTCCRPNKGVSPFIRPTETPRRTPTPTPSNTPTSSVTPTPSVTSTPSNTPTSTVTPTPSVTATPSNTPTSTITPTPSNTPTSSVTPTPSVTVTPSNTPTSSVTPTPSLTPSNTPTSTVTPTPSNTPTSTVTPTLSNTPTVTPTPSITPTISVTPSNTPTVTPSPTQAIVPSDPSLQIYYDASIDTNFNPTPLSGDTFTQWYDSSVSAHNANPIGGATTRPQWWTNVQCGLSAVKFDGTSDGLSVNPLTSIASITGYTAIVLGKLLNTGTTQQFVTSGIGNTSTNNSNLRLSGGTFVVGAAGGTAQTAQIADLNPHMWTMVFDGTQSTNADKLKFYVDGTQESLTFLSNIGTSTNASIDTLYIGVDRTGTSSFQYYYGGFMYEILLWTRVLSPSELNAVHNYLDNKWFSCI